MIYSFDLSNFEDGQFTVTRYPDNVAVGGEFVIRASSDKKALALAKKAAFEEWAAPDTRDPLDFEVEFIDSIALTRGKSAHAIKKSPTQLQRDIDQALAGKRKSATKTSRSSVADITLRPSADDTYAVLPVASNDVVRTRLRRAGIGWFLGFDPKNAADRAEIVRRIADRVGTDLTVAWGPPHRG